VNFQRSTEKMIIAALLGLLLGAAGLVIGAHLESTWISVLLINIGSFIIASVVMALIFEFWQLRGLLDDLFRHARIAEQIQRAQLSGFSVSFYDNVPWDELFKESNHLNIFVAYASTWRNTHHTHLQEFVSKRDTSLEVVLPDPEMSEVVSELALRFGISGDEVKKRIREAFEYFRGLGDHTQGIVRIYYLARAPQFTFYRFNNRAVFASYRHRPGRGTILTLVANRGGEFYEWVRDEWYGITRDGLSAGITRVAYDSTPADKVPLE
jgi:hypothetical protein